MKYNNRHSFLAHTLVWSAVNSDDLDWTQGTSLVAQWLRIRLPMQGTWVRSLVWEDPTCHGATNPMRHNYWDCALEPASHNYWARVPQLLKPVHPTACAPQQEKPPQWEARALQLKKARAQQRRLNTAKDKEVNKIKLKIKIKNWVIDWTQA